MNVSLADVPHKTRHLRVLPMLTVRCGCVRSVFLEMYVGAFSVSYIYCIYTQYTRTFCLSLMRFQMNDLYTV